MLSDGDTVTVYLALAMYMDVQTIDKVTFQYHVDPIADFTISPLTGCHIINCTCRYYWN